MFSEAAAEWSQVEATATASGEQSNAAFRNLWPSKAFK